MILKLRGVGNPDLQQFADVSEPCILEVGSFAEASIKTLEYIREWNIGGGNLTADIFDRRKGVRQIAHVSYNGMVWEGLAGLNGKLLYSPVDDSHKHKSRGIIMDKKVRMKFVCPKCGEDEVYEVAVDVTTYDEVNNFVKIDGIIEANYTPNEPSYGKVHYECKNCSHGIEAVNLKELEAAGALVAIKETVLRRCSGKLAFTQGSRAESIVAPTYT